MLALVVSASIFGAVRESVEHQASPSPPAEISLTPRKRRGDRRTHRGTAPGV